MIIVWHYRDLRLEDHPALSYAASTGLTVLPIYIHDAEGEGLWSIGAASKWWLHNSLLNFQKRYQSIDSNLVIRQGNTKEIFETLIKEEPVKEICWTERHQPYLRKRDHEIKRWFTENGIKVSIFEGNYLTHPEKTRSSSGTPYLVFSPFARAVKKESNWGKPLKIPVLTKKNLPKSLSIKQLNLIPKVPWTVNFSSEWTPGRAGAEQKLEKFCDNSIGKYSTARNVLAQNGTSLLSPHLAFGEISPKEIWNKANLLPNAEPFLRQILWREFANSFAYYFPKSTDYSWKEKFEKYPWENNSEYINKWQKGQTGYPIVDAGMRQLWQTGWMHNRTRMIVGSFLVKDLLIHWLEGARWFWDTLVDADIANNTLGWQWVAGSGPDAAPYFRIFNPMLQGKKFDSNGDYVRKYIPELNRLPKKWIHSPWEAPKSVLCAAGVYIGENYPERIVYHDEARKKALIGYNKIKTA